MKSPIVKFAIGALSLGVIAFVVFYAAQKGKEKAMTAPKGTT